jgi:hypothetical protein
MAAPAKKSHRVNVISSDAPLNPWLASNQQSANSDNMQTDQRTDAMIAAASLAAFDECRSSTILVNVITDRGRPPAGGVPVVIFEVGTSPNFQERVRTAPKG